MRVLFHKFLQHFFIVVAILLVAQYNSAQTQQPAKLNLHASIESAIKGGETQNFVVSLSAGQTARIEIVQNGVDVSLAAFDVKGEKFIETESPSGLLGNDLILVTAKDSGEYKIAVTPADPSARAGKYTIRLKKIRATIAEDFRINEASKKMAKTADEAYEAKYKGTLVGRRDALKKWRVVIELSKIKKDKVWEGIANLSSGLIYEQLGEFQNALGVYLQGLTLLQEGGSKQYAASSINNIGSVYASIGEYEKAIPYYEQAIIVQRELGNRRAIGIYLNNLGNAHKSLGNYDQAVVHFKQSLEIKKEDKRVRGKRSLANTINNLGEALIFQNEFETGIEHLNNALKLRKEIRHRWGIANSLLNLGEAHWKAGNNKESYENLKQANARTNEIGDRQLEARSFYHLAVAEKDRGNYTTAIGNVSKGLELIEQIRNEFIGSEIRYSYFATVQNYYELYVDLLISRYEKTKNKGDISLALEINERSRSRSLIELLQEAKVNFKEQIDTQLLDDLKNLQSEINSKYANRQRILRGKPKPEQVSKVNSEINNLNIQIQNLKIKIRRSNPKYADLTAGKTISVKEMQKLLDDETVLLEYKLGEIRSFVWLVTKDSINVSELSDRKTIEKLARRFYDLTIKTDRKDAAERTVLSEQLSKILLSKFASDIEGKRLAIVADGILQYLPFSALQDSESNYLADKNEIVMLPSASVLAQLRENPKNAKPKGTKIAVFADPVFDKEDSRILQKSNSKDIQKTVSLQKSLNDFRFGEELPRLLASRQEAKDISDLVSKNNAVVKMGFDASLENVENADLSKYQVIHFATHGLLNTSHPELSGLVFSLYDKNGQQRNGFLNLNNIYNLNLSSDMIVLSACQTALGKDVRGEGLIGMSRGFLYAGSKRIVASLWKVDDTATAEFMKRFYQNHLQKGMPASEALQQTKIEMKKNRRYQSPYFWSAFTLLGDWK